MRQCRATGVLPSRQPVRADVGGGIRELPNQDGRGLIVEAVVKLVGVGIFAAAGVAISE